MKQNCDNGQPITANTGLLLAQAQLELAEDTSEAIRILDYAIASESNAVLGVYYTRGYYAIICQTPSYKQDAVNYLRHSIDYIDNKVLPKLEYVYITLSTGKDTQLTKQIVQEIEIIRLIRKLLESDLKLVAECPNNREIRVTKVDYIEKILEQNEYDPDKLCSEISYLSGIGMAITYSIEQVLPPVNWGGVIFLTMAGIIQLAIAVVSACGGNIGLAAKLAIDAGEDFYAALKVLTGEMNFDIEEYVSRKSVAIVVNIAALGVETVISILSKGAAVTGGIASLGVKEAFLETIKEVGKKVIIDSGVQYLVNEGLDAVLVGLKEDISKQIEENIERSIKAETVDKISFISLAKVITNTPFEVQRDLLKDTDIYVKIEQKALRSVITNALDIMIQAKTNNPYIKAIGAIGKAVDAGVALQEASALINSVSENIQNSIDEIYSKEEKECAKGLIYTLLSPRTSVEQEQVATIVEKLVAGNVVVNGRFDINRIKEVDLGHYNPTKETLVELFNGVNGSCGPGSTVLNECKKLLIEDIMQKLKTRVLSSITSLITERCKSYAREKIEQTVNYINRAIHGDTKKHEDKIATEIQEALNKYRTKKSEIVNAELAQVVQIEQQDAKTTPEAAASGDPVREATEPVVATDKITDDEIKKTAMQLENLLAKEANSRYLRSLQIELLTISNTTDDSGNEMPWLKERISEPSLRDMFQRQQQWKYLSEQDKIIPIYDSVAVLINDKPSGLKDHMIPFLSNFSSYTTDILPAGGSSTTAKDVELPSTSRDIETPSTSSVQVNLSSINTVEGSAKGTAQTAEISLPVFEAIALKYGPKVARGFAKFALKNGMRLIPGVGLAIIAYDVYDVAGPTIYDIYNRLMAGTPTEASISEARGDDVQTKQQKADAKAKIEWEVIKKTESFDRCKDLEGFSLDELVQRFADESHDIVQDVLSKLPPLWNGENVLGILKHDTAHKLRTGYEKKCKDKRLTSEQHWRGQKALDGDDDERDTPGWTKGSVRLDVKTNIKKHPELTDEIYDYKFGKQGIKKKDLKKWIKHTESTIFKEVRPTEQGGITKIFQKEGDNEFIEILSGEQNKTTTTLTKDKP